MVERNEGSRAGPGPWWKDGRVYLLLLITLLTLGLGWLLKARCHDKPWDGYQWRDYCYSDVQALYHTRGAADGTWPYWQTFNEYPPLTGTFMHAMGALSHDLQSYLVVSALFLGLLALATTVLVAELVGRDRKVLYWALAPALALYAFYNWDLLAVAPAVGAILAFRRGHMGLAGVLLGLGAGAKLFPAFLAPALGVWILREDRGLRARGWRFGLGFVAVVAAVHLPYLLLNASQTIEAYTFQAKRLPNFETPWYAIAHLGREWGVGWMDKVDDKGIVDWLSGLPFLAAVVFSAWATWTRRLDPVVAACLPVFAFLAFNKVFSVQYTLWAIPLLVVCAAPRLLKAFVIVADLVVFLTLADYFYFWNTLNDGHLYSAAAFASIFRAGVYVAVTWTLARRAFAVEPATMAPREGEEGALRVAARQPPA